MSTTAVPSAAAQKQLKQGKVKKGIFSVIRHLVLALLAFIWLVPIAWLLLTSFSTDKGINFTRFVPESFTMWNYVSIMTQPDSATSFDLALGPDFPRADQLYPGNLGYSAWRIPTSISLLIPAFSLLNSPQHLTVLLLPVKIAPLPIYNVYS